MGYTYGDANHKHAVTALSNGNMTSRLVNGQAFNLGYDAENRMVQVSGAVTATATFGYDGDGQRVVGSEGGTTTVYIGNYFEWKGSMSTMVKYYYAGTTRVAMRTGTANLLWLLGDHLGSTSVVANYDGTIYSGQGYYAWGEKRYSIGVNPLPTTFRYTGQREAEGLGLYFYGARWYDAALGRFIQADTIIPLASQGVQAWDRYAYANNNPVRYNDPSGHDVVPPPQPQELVRQVVEFLMSMAYEIIDDPVAKSPYANGADLVAVKSTVVDGAKQITEVIAVECKATANSVNMGTLGKSVATGNIGGSIKQVIASANRFAQSSNSQLAQESQVIKTAVSEGNPL